MNGSGVLGQAPKAGVGLHFSSLPNEHGIGDIGDAALSFIDHLGAMRLRVWQFLPIGPTAYGDSPYQPLSAFAGNEMLIGLDELVRMGLLKAEEVAKLESLPAHTVDFGALIPTKHHLLSIAAGRMDPNGGTKLRPAYEEFLHRNLDPWLHEYALFRKLKTLHGERAWPEWDAEYVHREPVAIRRIEERYREDIENIKVAQFLFDHQWRELRARAAEAGIRLFGDIPIYIALDSADAWAHPEILLIDGDGRPSHVAGVPPDYFSEDGQLWGNPLYDWRYHADNGFRWWVERMQDAADRFDMLRVDHFRGFEAFWSVPFGEKTARKGRWEPGPRHALFEAMEAALGDLPIVAEDLGVITPEVETLRLQHDIPGMKVLQFEVEGKGFTIEDILEDCVCYTGTHDNDTTLGWFRGGKDDIRTPAQIAASQQRALQLTGGSPETISLDMIRLAFNSRAQVAMAPMQDFLGLGSEARINIPGTTLDNWRWRLRTEQLTPEYCSGVAELVETSSR